MDTFVGVDLGTTQLKAALFDGRGRMLARASQRYPLERPAPDAAEQDAALWWQALCDCLQHIKAEAARAHPGAWERMAGVSVTGQGPTVVAVDAGGHPLRPAVTWADRRCQAEADELGVYAGYSALARILWVARHDPDVYARTRWFFESYDYLTFRLTGEPVTIVSLPGYEPWTREQLEGAGLDPSKFPSRMELLGTVVGAVSAPAAEATGLPPGTPVVAGTVDAFAHWLGLGMTEKGRLCDIGGTSEGVGLSWDEAITDYANGIHPMPNPAGAGWICGGSMSNGGSVLSWFRNGFYTDDTPFEHVLEDIARTPAGADGMVALPYLMGERAPVQDPLARGCFFGVGPEHGRAHFGRAVLEGVAFGIRQIAEALETAGGRVDHVVASGGATRSSLWTQIKADVLGRPVYIPAVTETGLLGAAILARAAVTGTPTAAVAAEMVALAERFDPDPERQAVYDALYPTYASLYAALKDEFPRLARVRRTLPQV